MARVLLIVPHLPQRMGAAYLGQQYVAASLVAAGHEVRCMDLAAVYWDGTDDDAVAAVERWGPDMVGMTLFTYNARRGYELCRALRHATRLTVAGGPHATICHTEPVEHGFDVSVVGEGEHTIAALAEWLDAGGDRDALAGIPGIVYQAGDAASPAVAWGPAKGAIENLDGLAIPALSYPSYDASLYHADGQSVVPGGLMTSRGCPARCTFCANYVTGRTYRWRSTANVLAEMRHLAEHHGVRHFPFWDDAFTARPIRIRELCEAILADPVLRGCTWTCITPGNMVRARDLELMAKAGCVAINFGLESGDYNVLKVIQKGVRPERVKESVRLAGEMGMTTIVNFMFGFPEEDVEALKRTHDFMVELSESCDFFNNRGVLVPFPGTAIYDQWHQAYDLEGWWLDPAMVPDEPNLFVLDPTTSQTYLEHDPTLDLDFFRYSDAVRDQIAACVRFKAQHNARTIARRQSDAAMGGSNLDLQRDAAANVG